LTIDFGVLGCGSTEVINRARHAKHFFNSPFDQLRAFLQQRHLIWIVDQVIHAVRNCVACCFISSNDQKQEIGMEIPS
jgi:hypothetical protein